MRSDRIWRLCHAGVHMAVRSRERRPHVRGGWCVSVGHSRRRRSSTEQLLLSLEAALLGSDGGISSTDESVFDGSHKLWREDGFRRDGTRNGLFPGLEHLVHLPPGRVVNLGVGTHEDGVQLGPKVKCVRRGNILYYGIQHIEGWQCPGWRYLLSG